MSGFATATSICAIDFFSTAPHSASIAAIRCLHTAATLRVSVESSASRGGRSAKRTLRYLSLSS